jgi:hypothetical protein
VERSVAFDANQEADVFSLLLCLDSSAETNLTSSILQVTMDQSKAWVMLQTGCRADYADSENHRQFGR